MSYSLVRDFTDEEVVCKITWGSEVEYALISDNDGWLTPCIRFLNNSPYAADMWLYDEDVWNNIIPYMLREREQLLRELDKVEQAFDAQLVKNRRLLQGDIP